MTSPTETAGPRRSAGGNLALALGVTLLAKILVLLLGWACRGQTWLAHLGSDLSTWTEFFHNVRQGLVPYVDFTKEYPVGAALVYWVLGFLIGNPDVPGRVLSVHVLVMSSIDVLNTWLFHRIAWRLAPRRALLLTLCFSLNASVLLLSPLRFEAVIVTLVLLGYSAHLSGKPALAALYWSLGCSLKWFPAFFLAAQEYRAWRVEGRRRQWLVSGLVFGLVTLLLNMPFALRDYQVHGNFDNWLHPYLFHAHRPLYWDTLLAVGQLWLGPLPIEQQAGRWSLLLMAAALLLRPRQPLADKGVLICLAVLVCNRVYSTQFHLWFYPLLLLGAARQPAAALRWLLWHLAALDLLNVLVYPFAFTLAVEEMHGFRPYGAVLQGGTGSVIFSLAVVLRTMAVIALAIRLLRRPAELPQAARG